MTKAEKLEQSVRELYEAQDPNRDEWTDWLYPNHVLVVADYATELAQRFNAPVDQCRAAALLHDIADTRTSRFDTEHEAKSLEIARDLLQDAGFSDQEIATIVDDALTLHSCRDGQRPATLVGKVLSTADALGHLNTNFYTYTTRNLMAGRPEEWKRNWAAKKIPRDYYDKIAFDEVREETKPNFEKLSALFAQ